MTIWYPNHDSVDGKAAIDGAMGTTFPVVLFSHGLSCLPDDYDPLVSCVSGRRTYDMDPWPKAFRTVRGGNHLAPFVGAADPAFETVAATTTDFLRWSLYGDTTARRRFSRAAAQDGTGALDDRLSS